ncbi:MAG: hypothetical protein IPQ24_03380 [Anaeromyxobacter sp.]|nr:hypothetical protein [Anaeromyxobacter sp.]
MDGTSEPVNALLESTALILRGMGIQRRFDATAPAAALEGAITSGHADAARYTRR